MSKVMYIGRDDLGNPVIKAYDRSSGKTWGTKFGGGVRYIMYNMRDAERAFRREFGLVGVRFEKHVGDYMIY